MNSSLSKIGIFVKGTNAVEERVVLGGDLWEGKSEIL